MKYRHGSFTSLDGEFFLRGFSRQMIRGARGTVAYERVTLSGGFEIIADGQQAITNRYNQIAAAFQQDDVDSGFLHTSGSRSAIFLVQSQSYSGVQVMQRPGLDPQNGADYATGHVGSFSVQSDVLSAGGSSILDYGESLTFSGGGALWAPIITDTSPPYIVQTANQTPYFAVQEGFAVGRDGWPLVNQPLWPEPIYQQSQSSIRTEAPKRNGNNATDFRVSWSYRFMAPEPLSGLPNIR